MRHDPDDRHYGPHLHCDVIAALAGIGTALGVSGSVAAPLAGGLVVASVAGSLASTGLAIAGAVNQPDIPSAPTVLDSAATRRQAGAQRRFAAARTRNVVAPRPTLGTGGTQLGTATTLGTSDIPSIP